MTENMCEKGIQEIITSGTKSDKTKKFYEEVLNKIFAEEQELQKHYCDFEYSEIIDMLRKWQVTTLRSLKTINTILNKYMEYYIDKSMIEQRRAIFLSEDDLRDCVYSEYENKYFTSMEEYEYFINRYCYNSQDAVLYVLRFEGVGRTQHEEIRNLKEEDCDFDTNELTLTSHDKEGIKQTRTIKISEASMSVIKDAIKDTTYYKNNGEENPDNKTTKFMIYRNGYVVKYAGRQSYDPVKFYLINDRVKKLSTTYGKELLNPKNVFYSGMLLKLKELEETNGQLITQDFKDMHIRYGISTKTWHYTKQLYTEIKPFLS